jgi:hypothetical protein
MYREYKRSDGIGMVSKFFLMLLSSHQNAEQYHDIKIANRCFENVADFKYLGATVTN